MSFQYVRVQSAEVVFKAGRLSKFLSDGNFQRQSRDFVWVKDLNRSGFPSIVALGLSSQCVFK